MLCPLSRRAATAAGLFALLVAADPRAQVAWTQLSPAQSPSPRTAHGLAYDEVRHVAVLFGGGNATNSNAETWLWDGTNWQQAAPASAPSARKGHGMVYDSARGRIVLFGGGNNAGALFRDTWEWDGTTWTRVATTGPTPRWNFGMAYDPLRQRTVLVGGANQTAAFRETWEWDGVAWTLVSTGGPSARISPAVAWDGNRNTVLLYGGVDFYNLPPLAADVWDWNGQVWTKITDNGPIYEPGPQFGVYAAGMVWNPATRRVVLYGGTIALSPIVLGYSNESTFEWDGATWFERILAYYPAGRAWSPIVFDTTRETVLAFGGSNYVSVPGGQNVIRGDTSEYAPVDPAKIGTVGNGCPGSGGVPVLASVAQERPWIGEPFDLAISALPSGAPTWITVGVSKTTFLGAPLPLALAPIGGPGCALWSSVELSAPLANPNGTATLSIAISNDRALVAQTFYLQGLALDVDGRLITTNSLEGKIGSR